VCHGFRSTNRDDYFQVNFDHFWIKQYFWRQLGQYWILIWDQNRTTIRKFSLPKSVKRSVSICRSDIPDKFLVVHLGVKVGNLVVPQAINPTQKQLGKLFSTMYRILLLNFSGYNGHFTYSCNIAKRERSELQFSMSSKKVNIGMMRNKKGL